MSTEVMANINYLDKLRRQGSIAGLEILLEVAVNELEYEVQSALALYNVVQPAQFDALKGLVLNVQQCWATNSLDNIGVL
jgi:hypothetical protein